MEDILSHRNSIFPSRKASPQSADRLTAPSAEEAKKALTRTASTKKIRWLLPSDFFVSAERCAAEGACVLHHSWNEWFPFAEGGKGTCA